MMGVAALHFTGRGVPQDHSRAHQWLEKAAAAGNAAAMSAIGDNYAGGQGVPQDYAKARDWYEKAAATRDARAMIKLAEHYSKGQGVPQDYAKAREWLEKAVAVRDAGADGDLAFIALFARDFAQALNAATRALAAQPDSLWIATNRAHALMFLGRAEEAREVYLIHKNKRIPQNENKTWQQVIAEDFAELRKAGLDHPQMLEIEAALGILKK
jgi:predicted Zn-dependent protease